MSQVSPARKCAFAILIEVERGRGHCDTLLRGKNVEALSDADRKLTTALVLGTLRWQINLDQRIRPVLKHPNAKLDPEVLIALRLGTFQLLYMERIPARAAIDESVELAKQSGQKFAARMVNAVLRKLAARQPSPTNPSATEKAASTQASDDSRRAHPAWMVARWADFYGEDAIRAICRHGQQQPTTTVRLGSEAVERELTAEGIQLAAGQLLTAARRVISGNIASTRAYRDGRVRIQDEGSQLIAELAPRGREILDCCAAPGGKTLILAERNPTAKIVAIDGSPLRMAQLQKRLEPLGNRVQCRLSDATQINEAPLDVALADVPCSGTGTLGRNPEIRHRLQPDDLSRQAARQQAILRSSLSAVRPGGHVLYATCSLEPEENEHVVEAVLSTRPDDHLVSLQTRIAQLLSDGILTGFGAEQLSQSLNPRGYLRLLPGAFHTDGFFAALIERTR